MSDHRRDLDSLLLARHIRRSRLTAGPATLTPGPEVPAIVDLLTHGWTPTPTAPIATLLDLAARGHIHLVAESSGQLICRVPGPGPSEPLAPFERQLLWHAGSRLSGDRTPAAALLPDPDDEDGDYWYSRFKPDVIDEARRLGLVRAPFWGLGMRGTDAGRAAASRWLGVRDALLSASSTLRLPEAGASLGDRMLAWAVALGAAPDVPGALAPAGHDWVWSSAGGQWRQVRITRSSSDLLTLPWARSSEIMSQRRKVMCRVIRRWTMTHPSDQVYTSNPRRTYSYHVAVDDGRNEEALVWRVPRHVYKRLTRDSAVQVTVDHEGRVVEITEASGTRGS
jgi:hypothetical protein